MGTIVTVGLMIVAFIGMIVSVKIQKTNPNAKILAFVCLVVIIGCAFKFLSDTGVFGGESLEEREARLSQKRYHASISQRISDTYSASYKGKKVVILAPNGQDFNKEGNDLSFQNELKAAFEGANVVVTGLDYKPNENSPSGMEENMQPVLFEKFFKAHKDADLIVFALYFPYENPEFRKLSIWSNKNTKLIFAEATSDPAKFIGAQIEKGKILAIIVNKPNLTLKDYEKLAPSDLKKAFDERYILINKDNALKDYKKLFR